jgi:hypothetical protein
MAKLSGPIASGLMNAFSGKTPHAIVKGFALHLHANAQVHGPAFDPRAYAAHLDLPIKRAKLNADGLLAGWPGPSCAIILRENENAEWTQAAKCRENFTIAHEIGHYLIRENLEGFVPRSLFLEEHRDEELLCNAFAEELLMPSFCFGKDCEETKGSPSAMVRLAARYQVSLEALLYKIAFMVKRPFFAAVWKFTGSDYSVQWATPEKFDQLILCNTGRTTVERAYKATDEVEGRDEVVLDGKRMRWPCASLRLSGPRVLTIAMRSSRPPADRHATERPRVSLSEPVQLSLPRCA